MFAFFAQFPCKRVTFSLRFALPVRSLSENTKTCQPELVKTRLSLCLICTQCTSSLSLVAPKHCSKQRRNFHFGVLHRRLRVGLVTSNGGTTCGQCSALRLDIMIMFFRGDCPSLWGLPRLFTPTKRWSSNTRTCIVLLQSVGFDAWLPVWCNFIHGFPAGL